MISSKDDSELRKAFECIENIVNDKIRKQVAEYKLEASQSKSQIQTLTAELLKSNETCSSLEKRIQILEQETKNLRSQKNTLESKYASAKKASANLEKLKNVHYSNFSP